MKMFLRIAPFFNTVNRGICISSSSLLSDMAEEEEEESALRVNENEVSILDIKLARSEEEEIVTHLI